MRTDTRRHSCAEKKGILLIFSYPFEGMTSEKLYAATSLDADNQGDRENKDGRASGNIDTELEPVDVPLETFLRYESSSICFTAKVKAESLTSNYIYHGTYSAKYERPFAHKICLPISLLLLSYCR